MRRNWEAEQRLAKLRRLRELRHAALAGDEAWVECRSQWEAQARPKQLTPVGDWTVWFYKAGRGTGKTRSGAEDLSDFVRQNPEARIALVAPTRDDVRDTMVEGQSGLLSVLPISALRHSTVSGAWNRSQAEFYFANGAVAKGFSAEEPDRLRGPQHHRAWCDEPGAWTRDVDTWDNLLLGLRLGDHPQVVVTGTPKRTKLVARLLAHPGVVVVEESTYANIDNLAPTFAAEVLARYEGTRLGRQEIEGEYLEDVEGALWSLAQIDALRVAQCPELVRVVVAIDPAGTTGEDADETGIVVCGKGVDGHGYVLADETCRESPLGWARRAIAAYRRFGADRIVAETNFGGDMVEATLRQVDPSVPYLKLTASRGKRVRAEPVAALYEQGRVHHVGSFGALEDQMTTWLPDSGESPDRMDALVWGLSELMAFAPLSEYLSHLAFGGVSEPHATPPTAPPIEL